MPQLLILLISFVLIGLVARTVLRRPAALPPLPENEPLPHERRNERLRLLALDTPPGRLVRLRRNGNTLRMLQRLLKCSVRLPALDHLRDNGRTLLMHLMALRSELHQSLRLPGCTRGGPRLMLFCRKHLQCGGGVQPDDLHALLHALEAGSPLTLQERLCLPLCLRLCLEEQLHGVLLHLVHTLQEVQHGEHLARRLIRSRRPMAMLEQPLSLAQAHAMLTALHTREEAALLSALEERMTQDQCTPAWVSEQFAAQQARLTDRIATCLQAFRALDQLDWPAALESADPLHKRLLADPSGTYSRMDADSRLMYRRRIADLARQFKVDELHLTHAMLDLCRAAEPDGLQDHVGWYLLEYAGMRALQRHLHTRRGILQLKLRAHSHWLCRVALAASAAFAGVLFLNARHPLWMLPVFLGVFSCLNHALLGGLFRRLFPALPLPRMQVDAVSDAARTLVVMPVVLKDRSQAVPMVRRLLLARKAFAAGAIDCLLLADYGDSITRTSSEDPAIVSAVRMAMEAIDGDGGRFIYLQRSRAWDGDQRTYIGRERKRGALESLNQLIVHGECADDFDAHTVPLSFLHRRYAYVLTLDDNTIPAPDALLPLIGALSHPLNERRHTPEGVRGVSILQPRLEVDPDEMRTRIALWEGGVASPGSSVCSRYEGNGLYRPDAMVESTEGWFLPDTMLSPDLIEGELSGCALAASTAFYIGHPATVTGWLQRLHRRTRGAWQLIPWLFPFVKTPRGVRRNPLSSHCKYNLRQDLRRSLVPLCQLLLLLYAVLNRSAALFFFALIIPELPFASPWRLLARLTELPLRALVRGDAALKALWRMFFTHQHRLDRQTTAQGDAGAAFSAWENWSQALAAVIFSAAALAYSPLWLPGLALALLFLTFPLMHPWLDTPLHHATHPTPDMQTSLMDAAEATWRFFQETVTAQEHHLPPASLQLKPWRGAAHQTSPADIGMYLLSCLAAREMEIITTDEMCSRIQLTLSTLEQLPLWHGLPYSRYATDTLAVMDPPFVSSADCGCLCACLITLAQALRTFLPEMADEHLTLPVRVDDFAARMELSRLYNPQAQLFSTGFDPRENALASSHHDLYADEAQLLSFVAVMRRDVPLQHFARLNRTLVRAGKGAAYVSRSGSVSEYLMPRLLLPVYRHTMMEETLRTVIRAQKKGGVEGMFGISESGWWGFDAQMNYRHNTWGLPELALGPCAPHPVIAPYAAALCLPFALKDAHDCLMRLRSRGMLGRLGFFESIDFDPAHLPNDTEEAMVQSHIARHQGMLLCAVCNALTGDVLTRHFAAVPAAASAALLLKEKRRPRLTLPPRIVHAENLAPREAPFRRSAQGLTAPVDAHLIGSPEAMLLASAQGLGVMHSRGITLTHFTGDPTQIEGIQFYLNDGLSTYRLTDPALPGETIFTEGAVRFIRTCGCLQCTLTAMTDPVQGAFLHVVEVANLSSRERTFDLADCLVPALHPQTAGQPACSDLRIESARPEERVLTLTRRPEEAGVHPLTLCHAISTHEPLLALAAQTDRMAFQGRNCTLHQPASLFQPLQEGLIGAPVTPCASFRARLRVGSRGKAAVIFVTRLMRPGEAFSLEALSPRLSDVNSLLTVSRLLSRTMTDSISITQTRAGELTRLFGPLLWRCQPHQGALSPLRHPLSCLHDAGLDPCRPILTAVVHSPGCTSLLRDVIDTAAWLRLMGQNVGLCILCEGDQAALSFNKARELLSTQPAALLMTADLTDGVRECIEAISRLILYEGAGSITAQLEALTLTLPARPLPPAEEAPPLEAESLRLFNGLGGFQPGTDDYVIRLESGQTTPAPWCSLLTSHRLGTLCMESGLNMTFAGNSRLHRLTPWSSDPVCPAVGEAAYLAEGDHIFAPTPLPLGQGMNFRVQYSPGVTVWRGVGHGLDATLTAAVIPGTAFGCRTLRLKNMTQQPRSLRMTIAARFIMGCSGADEAFCFLSPFENGVAAHSPSMPKLGVLSLTEGHGSSRVVSPAAFHGYGQLPDLDAPDDEAGTLALLETDLSLPAGGNEVVTWVLGACRQMDDLEQLLHRIRQGGVSVLFRAARQKWAARLGAISVSTPDESLNLLMNRILPWQVRTSRLEGRCSFDRACGAVGFRDQLQDMTALVHTDHALVRAHLLNCARHQYTDGDVQHWWHPPQTGARTRISDDRIYLPFMTGWYIRRTGDSGILEEQIPWLLGDPVPDGREELVHTPPSTNEKDSLYIHCLRALTSIQLGPHGLPLVHAGDGIDSMNRISGESVWLGMFLVRTLHDFAPYAPQDAQAEMLDVRARVMEAIERSGWDGSWYMRAFFADGAPLGSASSLECRIDTLCQSWAVLALGVTQRSAQAVDQAWQQLFDARRGLLKLFAPPFDGKTDAGAISGYVPGICENGGQSTRTAVWMLWALCELGWADRAWMLLQALNPIRHGSDPQRYRLEPYALSGDVYTHSQQTGRGGRSHYTGGAAWLYTIVLEKLLGFDRQGDQVRLQPMVPPDWDGFSLTLQWGSSTWHFHALKGETALTCDGETVTDGWVTLRDDGRIHEVRTPLRQG